MGRSGLTAAACALFFASLAGALQSWADDNKRQQGDDQRRQNNDGGSASRSRQSDNERPSSANQPVSTPSPVVASPVTQTPVVPSPAPAPSYAPPAAAAPPAASTQATSGTRSDQGEGGQSRGNDQGNAGASQAPAAVASSPQPNQPPSTARQEQGDEGQGGAASSRPAPSASGQQGVAQPNTSGSAEPGQANEDVRRKAAQRATAAKHDAEPPQTVYELLKRVFQPSPGTDVAQSAVPTTAAASAFKTTTTTTTPSETAAAPATPKTATATATTATPTTTAAASKPAAGGRIPLASLLQTPDPGTAAPRELLALNVTPSVLARAAAIGLKSQGTINTGSGLTVTRLQAAADIDLAAARMLLSGTFPDSGFAYNRLYRLVPATGEEPGRPSSHGGSPGGTEPDKGGSGPDGQAKAGKAKACAFDHCYGPELVGWRPQLDSCTAKIRVGIVDTAVDRAHPAFKATRLNVGNFAPISPASEKNWHGTGVAAMLAGAPGSSTPGLIPSADFYLADIFSADATGAPVADSFHLVQALEWLSAFDVKIVNLSMSGPKDELVEHVIARLAAEKGVVFVAAAGNGGPGAAPSYPAAYPHVIAVTAVSKDMRSYRHANHGSYIDVSAPGVNIWTAAPDGGEGFQSGTSFAVPFVTAAIAAIYRSVPHKTKAAILDSLEIRDLGAPGRDDVYGRGLLVAPHSCTVDYARLRPAGTWPAPTVLSQR